MFFLNNGAVGCHNDKELTTRTCACTTPCSMHQRQRCISCAVTAIHNGFNCTQLYFTLRCKIQRLEERTVVRCFQYCRLFWKQSKQDIIRQTLTLSYMYKWIDWYKNKWKITVSQDANETHSSLHYVYVFPKIKVAVRVKSDTFM